MGVSIWSQRRLTAADGRDVDFRPLSSISLAAFAQRPRRCSRATSCSILQRQGRPGLRSQYRRTGALAQKIEADPAQQLVITVRGGGYMFTPAVTR